MPDILLERALLPSGWARRVRVSVDGHGTLREVEPAAAHVTGGEEVTVVSGVTVPGVPNVHSHAFQRALAGRTERSGPGADTFWTWRERMYAFVERLRPQDVEAIAGFLFGEMLRHGYTAVGEFHYLRNRPDGRPYDDPAEMAHGILAAAARSGIGVTLLPVVYRTSDFGGAPPAPRQLPFVAAVDDLLADVERIGTACRDDPQRRVGLALHSLRAVPPDALDAALSGLDGIDPTAPVHIHAAEQTAEVDGCVAWSGRRPVAWLLDHAPVGPRWCVIHATHVDAEERAALARSGAVAGLCPTTEANLGDGVFPFAEWVAAGGAWAVGTDSHVSVSPVADLRTLEYGQRLLRRRRAVAAGAPMSSTGRALLEGAWRGGAAALGRPLGRIEAGCRADLVVLDADHPAVAERDGDDVLDGWIFAGEDTPVSHVMVGGRWVVRDGRHRDQDGLTRGFLDVLARLRD